MQYQIRTILATICYYDAMEYPLTAFEVWKFLMFEYKDIPQQYRQPQSLYAIKSALDIMVRNQYLVCYKGFYTLPHRQHFVQQRVVREVLSINKLRKMRRWMRVIRYFPFVRMIWVTGRLAMKYAQTNSDLDVLIVLRRGRIWTGRAIITALIHVLGWRRHGRHTRDRLCLNYFITTGSLRISLGDRFSAHEYTMARCLFSSINPKKFLKFNQWIRGFRPHFDSLQLPSRYFVGDSWCSYHVRKLTESLFDFSFIEKVLRYLQRMKIMRNPKTYQKNSMIIVNDDELIFLPHPHSPKVLQKYRNCCHAQGLAI